MGDDHISTLPGILEISLEPLHRGKIDKIGRLIEKEKVWSREEDLGESDFCTLTSGDFSDRVLEEVKYPESSRDTVDLSSVVKSTSHPKGLEEGGVVLDLLRGLEMELCLRDLCLEREKIGKSEPELLEYTARL